MLALAGEQAGKPVPTRLSWLYTTGALALFFFALQFFTGCLLLTLYVPEETLAFKSVQTIEYHARLGWLIRQMHSWGASFIIVVLVLHMLKVVWYGSYKRPREFTWFVGMLLLGVSMIFCFSGYLLPWNQLAFWATRVGLGAVDSFPVIGPTLKELICGGEDVSGATLGRFFALHVVVLPLLLLALVGYHLALITWKGISPKTTVTDEIELGNKAALAQGGSEPFFPRQVYRDLIACNLGFALLVTFATWWPWHLGEPADRFGTPEGIKPEWYFLPMYQFLKYFDDNLYSALPFLQSWGVNPAFLGVLTINLVGLALFLLPVIDRGKERKITRRPIFASVAFLVLLGVVGMGVLGHLSDEELWGYEFSSKGYPTRSKTDEKSSTGAAGEDKAQEEASGEKEEGGGGGSLEDEEDGAAAPVSTREDGLADGGTCGNGNCHEDEQEDWAGSAHHAGGVQCVNCHGGIDTEPPEQFLAALELLFKADEAAKKAEEEEARREEEARKKRAEQEKAEKEKAEQEKAEKEKAEKEKAEKGKGEKEEESSAEEKEESEEEKPAEDKPEKPAGDTPEKPQEGSADGEKPSKTEGDPKEGDGKSEEPEEEEEPPEPRLDIKWHRRIETPEQKRLFIYAHQGVLVDSRGRPDHPDDDDLEEAGRFCGRCHAEVLEHYLAARLPTSGGDSEGEDTGTAHTNACWDCHDNHEVHKPGDEQWDDGYADEDDELTKPFMQIRKQLDGLAVELAETGKTIKALEDSGYPVDGNVEESQRFKSLEQRASQLRPAVHRLDPDLVAKGVASISEELKILSDEIEQRKTGREKAEKQVVTWSWIIAGVFSLLCGIKLFKVGDMEPAAEPAPGKPRKSSQPKKKKPSGSGRKRKSSSSSGKKKSSKSRDVSDFQSERDALLDPLDSDDEK